MPADVSARAAKKKSALQHYLPAAFLGGFSADNAIPRRERVLGVGDHLTGKCFSLTAERIGVTNLYTQQTDLDIEFDFEQLWGDYETRLPAAIDDLVAGTLDGKTWARILVPFVTCLFLRGPDFEKRFTERLASWGAPNLGPSNARNARSMEIQRMLAPVLACRWGLGRTRGEPPLITNDIGFTGYRDPDTGEPGVAIPLTRRHVLTLVPCRRRPILRLINGSWYPIIERRTLNDFSQISLNANVSAWARRFIFGSDEKTVASYLKTRIRKPPGVLLDPTFVGFIGGVVAMVYEFTWHRLVSYLEQASPDDTDCLTSPIMDAKAIAADWHPPIVIPTSHEISLLMLRAIRREGNLVIADLTDKTGLMLNLDRGGFVCPS